jgi:hypothetical protein
MPATADPANGTTETPICPFENYYDPITSVGINSKNRQIGDNHTITFYAVCLSIQAQSQTPFPAHYLNYCIQISNVTARLPSDSEYAPYT